MAQTPETPLQVRDKIWQLEKKKITTETARGFRYAGHLIFGGLVGDGLGFRQPGFIIAGVVGEIALIGVNTLAIRRIHRLKNEIATLEQQEHRAAEGQLPPNPQDRRG